MQLPSDVIGEILTIMSPFARYQTILVCHSFNSTLEYINRNLHPTVGNLSKIDGSKSHTKYAVIHSDVEIIKRLPLREYAIYVAAKLGKYDLFISIVGTQVSCHTERAAFLGGEPRIIKYVEDVMPSIHTYRNRRTSLKRQYYPKHGIGKQIYDAIKNKNIQSISLFNIKTSGYRSGAFVYACKHGYLDAVERLIGDYRMPDVGIELAAMRGHTEVVQLITSHTKIYFGTNHH